MFNIREAEFIAPGIKRFVIEAPRIAKRHQAGQVLILRLDEHGERIPLTIEDACCRVSAFGKERHRGTNQTEGLTSEQTRPAYKPSAGTQSGENS